jgi:hypothetical protein
MNAVDVHVWKLLVDEMSEDEMSSSSRGYRIRAAAQQQGGGRRKRK